jgi:hypothetical protein
MSNGWSPYLDQVNEYRARSVDDKNQAAWVDQSYFEGKHRGYLEAMKEFKPILYALSSLMVVEVGNGYTNPVTYRRFRAAEAALEAYGEKHG